MPSETDRKPPKTLATDSAPPLRVGLLVNGNTVRAWVWRMLERLHQTPYSEVCAIIVREADAPEPPTKTHDRSDWRDRTAQRLKRFYLRQDQSTRRQPDAFERRPLNELLVNVPRLRGRVNTTLWSDRLIAEDLEAIRAADLDVLIRIGFRILRGGILKAARYGVWSFHHGDNRVNRGGPAAYWEVMNRELTTGSTLQVLTEDLDNGIVLARTTAATHPVSYTRNRNALYWQALSLIPRELERLHRGGGDGFRATVERERRKLEFYDRPLYSTNTLRLGQALRHTRDWLGRKLHAKLHQKLYREHWELRSSVDAGGGTTFRKFEPLAPPDHCYWADPCAVEQHGKYYVFVEDFVAKTKLGHISVLTLDAEGHLEDYRPALQRPYHLSYPFVFRFGGEIYMIPETGANRTIELYRCDRFPDEWTLVRTLFSDVYAVDATVHEDPDGRWWLLANMVENQGASSSSELFLFHTESDPVNGEWHPHPCNPIVSDATKARPAGRLFSHHGRLYRPAQDCSGRYGRGIVINEVLELTPQRYVEREHQRIYARWDPRLRGTHTYCREGALTVIDVVGYAPRWPLMRRLPASFHNWLSLPY